MQCLTSRCYSEDFDYGKIVGIAQRVVCWKCGEEYDATPYGLIRVLETKEEKSKVILRNYVPKETMGERRKRLREEKR